MPSATGGSNWQGAALDPATNLLYVFSNTAPTSLGLLPLDAAKSDFGYAIGTARDPAATPGSPAGDNFGPMTVQGLPIIKPPYGRITALDLNSGTMAWQIAHGDTPDTIRANPALKGLTIPRTGRQGRIGVLVTKTLVIAGEGGFATTPGGRRGALLRAYDKATGRDVGAVYMPAPQSGSPMTYMVNGKQYIAVAVSGAGYSGELIAFALGS
jgi:quinoprotein glucose dehydrogenase